MNNEDKRKHLRVDTLNLLNYVCMDDEGNVIKHGMGRTLNVSESGILLETHVPLEEQRDILLTIGFEDDLVDVKGKIVHSKPSEGEYFQSGIQFMEQDEQVRSILKLYIDVFRKGN